MSARKQRAGGTRAPTRTAGKRAAQAKRQRAGARAASRRKAASAAPRVKKTKRVKAGGSNRDTVLFGMALAALGTALALYVLPVFVIVYGGMLPTLVAFLIDEHPRQQLFRTVAAMNLAGVVGFIEPAWRATPAFGLVGYPVSDAAVWFVILGSAIGGFALAWGLPLAAGVVLEITLKARLERAEAALQALTREWSVEERDGR